MEFGIYFEKFMRGEHIPELGSFIFQDIAQRAKAIIAGCDEDDLESEVTTLRWMFEVIDPSGPEREFHPAIRDEPLKGVTPAAQLYNSRAAFNLQAGDLTWPQYFALLALLAIEQAWFLEQVSKGENFPKHYTDLVPVSLLAYAVDGTEAVCHAEMLSLLKSTDATIEEQVKQALSTRNADAARKRHAFTNELKGQFVMYYYRGTFKSRADAARRFYESLNPKPRNPTRDNAVRFFADALREYEQSQFK